MTQIKRLKDIFKRGLFKTKNLKSNRKKGFTLIEVMVTVTIIGLLSSLGMVCYSTSQQKAKENIDYATAANIATAAQMAITNGETTYSVDSLVTNGYLQSTPKSQQKPNEEYSVTVTDDKVVVKLGTVQYYPKTN